jgi:hypothetical protein
MEGVMPTYRYTGSTERSLVVPGGFLSWSPGETKAIDWIIEDVEFEQTDPAPFHNPILANSELSFTASGIAQEVAIANIATAKSALVWQVTGCNVTVYLRSISNTPAIAVLRPGDSLKITLSGKADKLVFVPDGAGSCVVIESSEDLEV